MTACELISIVNAVHVHEWHLYVQCRERIALSIEFLCERVAMYYTYRAGPGTHVQPEAKIQSTHACILDWRTVCRQC